MFTFELIFRGTLVMNRNITDGLLSADEFGSVSLNGNEW